jgi:hypothetical protein
MSKMQDDIERGKELLREALRPPKEHCSHGSTHVRGVWIICDDCNAVVCTK